MPDGRWRGVAVLLRHPLTSSAVCVALRRAARGGPVNLRDFRYNFRQARPSDDKCSRHWLVRWCRGFVIHSVGVECCDYRPPFVYRHDG